MPRLIQPLVQPLVRPWPDLTHGAFGLDGLYAMSSVYLDFANRRYKVGSWAGGDESAIPGITISSLGSGTYLSSPDASGVVYPFTGAQIMRTNLGADIWEGRTNLSTQAYNTSGGGWFSVNSGVSVTNGQPDPFGGTGAALIAANGVSTTHYDTSTTVSFTSGTTYTLCRLVKPAPTTLIQLTGAGGAFGTSNYANFSLTGAGSITAQAGLLNASVEALAGGWYRLCITLAAKATGPQVASLVVFIASGTDGRGPTNTSTGSVYTTGANVTAGSFATPGIVTAGSAVTRNAAAPTLSNFSLPAGQDFSEFWEVVMPGDSGATAYALDINDGTTNNHIRWAKGASGTTSNFVVTVGGSSTNIGTGNLGGPRRIKLMLVRRGDNYRAFANGVLTSGSSVVAGMPTLSSRRLGALYNGGGALNGAIVRVASFSRALSDTEAVSLTAL